MSNDEIVTQLSQRIPSEVIYAITPHSILTAIVQRIGEDALTCFRIRDTFDLAGKGGSYMKTRDLYQQTT